MLHKFQDYQQFQGWYSAVKNKFSDLKLTKIRQAGSWLEVLIHYPSPEAQEFGAFMLN
jgi:hypothetical protein